MWQSVTQSSYRIGKRKCAVTFWRSDRKEIDKTRGMASIATFPSSSPDRRDCEPITRSLGQTCEIEEVA